MEMSSLQNSEKNNLLHIKPYKIFQEKKTVTLQGQLRNSFSSLLTFKVDNHLGNVIMNWRQKEI